MPQEVTRELLERIDAEFDAAKTAEEVRAVFKRHYSDLGWKRLIPVALAWLLLLGAIRIGQDEEWFATNDVLNAAAIVGISVLIAFVCGVGILVAMRAADRQRLVEARPGDVAQVP